MRRLWLRLRYGATVRRDPLHGNGWVITTRRTLSSSDARAMSAHLTRVLRLEAGEGGGDKRSNGTRRAGA